MINIFSKLIRNVSILFLSNHSTYFIGMIAARIGRWFRTLSFNQYVENDFHTITMFNNIKITVDRFSYMGGTIFWTGFHHISEALYLKKYLSKNMTFVDVGANQGEFSLIAASILTSGTVIAFEPVSHQRKLLEKNKGLNNFNNIEIFPFGLSNKIEELPIYTSSDKTLHHGKHEGLSSIFSSDNRNEQQEIIEIKIFDDIFFEKLNRIDFIKIDIEGAELFALQGMEKSIKKFHPSILIEINEETFKTAGYTTNDVIAFFTDLGYNFYEIKRGQLSSNCITNFEKWGNYIARYTK
jgi:FkbM family methyltransferase